MNGVVIMEVVSDSVVSRQESADPIGEDAMSFRDEFRERSAIRGVCLNFDGDEYTDR